MLTQKFIGRVMTDTELGPLYEELIREAGLIIVEDIQWHLGERSSPKIKAWLVREDAFWKKLAHFLSVCKQRKVRTPKKMSLRMFRRFILQKMLEERSFR